ncbi:hypothetical protein FRC12_023719, partial [Ceratobasidium sp. 428]
SGRRGAKAHGGGGHVGLGFGADQTDAHRDEVRWSGVVGPSRALAPEPGAYTSAAGRAPPATCSHRDSARSPVGLPATAGLSFYFSSLFSSWPPCSAPGTWPGPLIWIPKTSTPPGARGARRLRSSS